MQNSRAIGKLSEGSLVALCIRYSFHLTKYSVFIVWLYLCMQYHSKASTLHYTASISVTMMGAG